MTNLDQFIAAFFGVVSHADVVDYRLPDGSIVSLTPLAFGSDPRPLVVSFTMRDGAVVDAVRVQL